MPYKDKTKGKKYHTEYMKKYREENQDKIRQINKKAEQKEKRKEYRRKWWNENPKAQMIKERFKQNNPEIQKQYDKTYKEKNPERARKKYEKYYNSVKGVINRLKKADKKRFGINNNNIDYELITSLDLKYLISSGNLGPFWHSTQINTEYSSLSATARSEKTKIY